MHGTLSAYGGACKLYPFSCVGVRSRPGQAKPLSLIHSHERAGRRSSIPPTFVRQERPNQGFSPPAARLFGRAAAAVFIFNTYVLQSRGAFLVLTGVLSNSRDQKEDLRVETCLRLLRRHLVIHHGVITVKLPKRGHRTENPEVGLTNVPADVQFHYVVLRKQRSFH